MLRINNLHVNVGDKELLKGVNLIIPNNEVHALFGANGSGKSVLISTIMGYPEYKITQGEILFNEQNITELSINERAKLGLGISEQRPPTIKGVKLCDLLELLVPEKMKDKEILKDAQKRFNMAQFFDRNINDGLSGGEIKKSELFLLLMTKPKFLILDEPDSGVDPEHLKMIGAMINEILLKSCNQHSSVARNSGLIATHSAIILDYVHTDKAHIMLNGRIWCSGNPAVMMDQIRTNGYQYCIQCQRAQRREQ